MNRKEESMAMHLELRQWDTSQPYNGSHSATMHESGTVPLRHLMRAVMDESSTVLLN